MRLKKMGCAQVFFSYKKMEKNLNYFNNFSLQNVSSWKSKVHGRWDPGEPVRQTLEIEGGSINSGTLTHGGRPVSSDNDAVQGVEDWERHVQELSEAQVDAQFLEIIEDMNIPKDKREPLLAKTKEERQKMILYHLKGKQNEKYD